MYVVVEVHNIDILHTLQHSCTAPHSVCPYSSHLIGMEWMCILTTETAVAEHVCAVYVRVGGILFILIHLICLCIRVRNMADLVNSGHTRIHKVDFSAGLSHFFQYSYSLDYS